MSERDSAVLEKITERTEDIMKHAAKYNIELTK